MEQVTATTVPPLQMTQLREPAITLPAKQVEVTLLANQQTALQHLLQPLPLHVLFQAALAVDLVAHTEAVLKLAVTAELKLTALPHRVVRTFTELALDLPQHLLQHLRQRLPLPQLLA